MRLTKPLICAIAVLLPASAALAAAITNRDSKDVSIFVVEGSQKQNFVLQIGKSVNGVCEKGCVVRLQDSDSVEYELEGSESLLIEDGILYYENSSQEKAPKGSIPDRGGPQAK